MVLTLMRTRVYRQGLSAVLNLVPRLCAGGGIITSRANRRRAKEGLFKSASMEGADIAFRFESLVQFQI